MPPEKAQPGSSWGRCINPTWADGGQGWVTWFPREVGEMPPQYCLPGHPGLRGPGEEALLGSQKWQAAPFVAPSLDRRPPLDQELPGQLGSFSRWWEHRQEQRPLVCGWVASCLSSRERNYFFARSWSKTPTLKYFFPDVTLKQCFVSQERAW